MRACIGTRRKFLCAFSHLNYFDALISLLVARGWISDNYWCNFKRFVTRLIGYLIPASITSSYNCGIENNFNNIRKSYTVANY